MGLKEFFSKLESTPSLLPRFINIPNANTDDEEGLEGPFEPSNHYFTVQINEMFLSQQRKWFSKFEPMVVCITNYIYGEQEIEKPFIVGRNLVEANMKNVPDGMVFQNTRVAGIHPYAGGGLILSIALCYSVTDNYLTKSLEFVEKISGVLSENITNLVGNYTKIARVVISGIDVLLDSKAVEPLFGYRIEFDRDANDKLFPGYYVMFKSATDFEADNFFVKDNQLYYGKDRDHMEEFRETDYVLVSITRSKVRSDVTILPYYQHYKKIVDELKVNEVSQDLKDKIKRMLTVLNIEMQHNPDLTQPHAKKLIEKYIGDVSEMIQPKFNFSAGKAAKEDYWDSIDEKIASM